VSQKQKQPVRTPKSNLPAYLAAAIVIGVLVLSALSLGGGATPAAEQPVAEMAVTSVVTMMTATVEPAAPADAAAPAPTGKQYAAAPAMSIDVAKSYTATISTPRGDIVIKLRPDLAPETVNSFIFLARDGYYDGLTWHRVIPDFMAQGGDPTGTGMGGPGCHLTSRESWPWRAQATMSMGMDRSSLLPRLQHHTSMASIRFLVKSSPVKTLSTVSRCVTQW
jgi:peptidylprolyl isomerase